MESEGMVAVVRGLPDAGLTVTIMDGNKKYTMMPKAEQNNCHESSQVRYAGDSGVTRHEGTQAIDGQYASTYQMMHCHLRPTSPPVQLSEFPPQRQNVCPGHSNFEIGGAGSGETHTRFKSSAFRGAMNWPDKECIWSPAPRANHEADPFVSSLRKYPTTERTSDMVERVLSIPQGSKTSCTRNQQSPARLTDCADKSSGRTRATDKELKIKIRNESPTKERKSESAWRGSTYPEDYDVRCLTNITRKLKECVRDSYPFNWPVYPTKEELEEQETKEKSANICGNSVESQVRIVSPSRSRRARTAHATLTHRTHAPPAPRPPYLEHVLANVIPAVTMVSREVATVPKRVMPRRTIAVPFSSSSNLLTEGETDGNLSKSIQTASHTNYLKTAQTTTSSIELNRQSIDIGNRKTKSQEEFKISDVVNINFEDKTFNCKLCDVVKQVDFSEQTTEDKNVNYNQKCLSNIQFKENYHQDKILIMSGCELELIIQQWINSNITEYFLNCLDKDLILKSTTEKIKALIINESISDNQIRVEIIKELEKLPIKDDIRPFINVLIDVLFEKLNITFMSHDCENNRRYCNNKSIFNSKYITEDIRYLVEDILEDFLEKYNIKMCDNLFYIIEDDITFLLIDTLELIKFNNDACVKIEMINILQDLGQFTSEQSEHITNIILYNLKNLFNGHHYCHTYTVCQFQSMQSSKEFNTEPFSEDVCIDLQSYKRQITNEIDEWLIGLKVSKDLDTDVRNVVINYLVEDIIDRYKYLNTNTSESILRSWSKNELKHLKFQILKWINKFIAYKNMDTVQHAQELIDRIKSIPIPNLTRSQSTSRKENQSNRGSSNGYNHFNNTIYQFENESRRKWNIPNAAKSNHLNWTNQTAEEAKAAIFETSNEGLFFNLGNMQNNATHCNLTATEVHNDNFCKVYTSVTQESSKVPMPTPSSDDNGSNGNNTVIEEINKEYDNYFKKWVQGIPIAVNQGDPEAQKMVDTARLGIYNGIWKAVTKLTLDSKVYNNNIYYQDMLDVEIDQLLSNLPQTEQLMDYRDRLEAQLLEKMVTMTEQIRNAVTPSGFKQQLLQNITNNIPKTHNNNNQPNLQDQELFKIGLIDDYVLYTNFIDDEVKGNIYRKNFLKKIEQLTNNIRKQQDTGTKVHANDLISAISKVPVPDRHIVQEEANQILLGKEIDHWLTDVSLKEDLTPSEKRRISDIIAKKVDEIRKRMDLSSSSAQAELLRVLPKQIEKLPIENKENVTFLIEELANRLQNLPKSDTKRISVAFQVPPYADFSRNMPGCSSFAEPSGYDGSYMVAGEDIVRDPGPQRWVNQRENTIPEEQWLSMEETKAPLDLRNWSQELSGRPGPQPHGRNGLCDLSQPLQNQVPLETDTDSSYRRQSYAPSQPLNMHYYGLPTVKVNENHSLMLLNQDLSTIKPGRYILLPIDPVTGQPIKDYNFNLRPTIPETPNLQRMANLGTSQTSGPSVTTAAPQTNQTCPSATSRSGTINPERNLRSGFKCPGTVPSKVFEESITCLKTDPLTKQSETIAPDQLNIADTRGRPENQFPKNNRQNRGRKNKSFCGVHMANEMECEECPCMSRCRKKRQRTWRCEGFHSCLDYAPCDPVRRNQCFY